MFGFPQTVYTQVAAAALFGLPGAPGQGFIYESDYYRGVIEKANLTNPTQLTSDGERFEIQHVCIDRRLPTCVLMQAYFAPNLAQRTNGQVQLSVTSFVELGLTGPDTLSQVSDGSLDMVKHLHGLRGRSASGVGSAVAVGSGAGLGNVVPDADGPGAGH